MSVGGEDVAAEVENAAPELQTLPLDGPAIIVTRPAPDAVGIALVNGIDPLLVPTMLEKAVKAARAQIGLD